MPLYGAFQSVGFNLNTHTIALFENDYIYPYKVATDKTLAYEADSS